MGIATQSYGANTFYSAKYNNQYEKTDHGLASLNLSLHNQEKTWEIAPQFYYNKFKDHYQLIRGTQIGENYHDLDVYGGGLNANVAWALGKTAVGFDISKECIYSTALGEELAEKDYKDISGSDRQYTRKGERTNTNIMLEHNFIFGGFTLSAGVLANKNTGSRDADEVVQLYIRDMVASISRPVKELKGFQRIHLAAGESREISFDITPEMLKFYNTELKHVIEPGDFQIMVGGNSKEVKTQNLIVKN